MDNPSTTVVKLDTHALQALIELASVFKRRLPLQETLNAILPKIAEVLPQVDFGAVVIWDQSFGLFRPWVSYGCDPQVLKRIGLRSGESITGKVYDDGRPMLLNTPEQVFHMMEDMRPANRALFFKALNREDYAHSAIAALVATAQQKFGVLVLQTFQPGQSFRSEDIAIVQAFADLTGLAMELSRLEARSDAISQSSEIERMRSEALATLSHELRMPLTTIKGYTTMLLMDEIDWQPEKYAEYLQLIDEECDSMQMMIKNILDSSLVDFNQIPIETQPVRLYSIAHDVANEIQRESTFAETKALHRLVVDMPQEMPVVYADPRWIKQVFRNILDNAIKYSPHGGLVVIRAEVRKESVVICISDQGIGISPEDLIPLFEKFFRVRSPHTRHIPGTGLGLTIARAIVEMHGGRIWAESQLGQGTTVYFSLPTIQPPASPSRPGSGEAGFALQPEDEGGK